MRQLTLNCQTSHMYTEPQIVHNPSAITRSYIKFYLCGKRYRIYNGKPIGLSCFPNEAPNSRDKIRLLDHLRFELKKSLEKGWRPNRSTNEDEQKRNAPFLVCLENVLKQIDKEDLSERYKMDLSRIGSELSLFMKKNGLGLLSNSELSTTQIATFLDQFKSSSGYYMTKRSSLGGLLSRFVQAGLIETNLVWKTSRKKIASKLNGAYTKDELRSLLRFLQSYYPNLHLCALLMYGCFLRPHREIRLLKRRHFNREMTLITLGGDENKGKRIRIIPIPQYVTVALMQRGADQIASESYIISGTNTCYNEDYFKTMWGRMKEVAHETSLIRAEQSLYSFRHTAAIDVFLRTKDPYKVQQLMGHSTLVVTLTYLRSLGLITQIQQDYLPEI